LYFLASEASDFAWDKIARKGAGPQGGPICAFNFKSPGVAINTSGAFDILLTHE
jgi:hypothetical protein